MQYYSSAPAYFHGLVQVSINGFVCFKWIKLFQDLENLQKRITRSTNTHRRQRDLQRLLRRGRSVQIIVVFRILQKYYPSNRQTIHSHWLCYKPDYLIHLKTPTIVFDSFNGTWTATRKNGYPVHHFLFYHDLWVLCLLPVLEKRLHTSNLHGRAYRRNWDAFYTICEHLRFSGCNWITALKISTPLSKSNKLQLLNTFYVEKKFLAIWFRQRTRLILPDRITAQPGGYLSFQSLVDAWLVNQLIEYLSMRGYQPLFYARVLLIFSQYSLIEFSQPRIMNSYSRFYSPTRDIQVHKSQSIQAEQGFNFLGWNFSRCGGRIITTISQSNLCAHCREINQLLKSSTRRPDDKTIRQLNQKIQIWQNYYGCAYHLNKTWYFLNRWLFWRIWRWVKKRHHDQSSKWLYGRYWTIRGFSFKSSNKLIVGGLKAKNVHNSDYYCWCFKTHDIYALHYKNQTRTRGLLPGKINVFESKERHGLSHEEHKT